MRSFVAIEDPICHDKKSWPSCGRPMFRLRGQSTAAGELERSAIGASLIERPLSQVEAAKFAGCSRDTIVRARRAGRFPGARLDRGGWTIPPAELVAAGLCRSTGPDDPHNALALEDAESDATLDVELARSVARIVGLEEVIARQDDELRFLRATVETLAKQKAA